MALLCGLMGGAAAHAQSTPAAAPAASATESAYQAAVAARILPDIRYVVFHTPGPAWVAGRSLFEQPGIREHIAHYRTWFDAGKLLLGGPHTDGQSGGMMIPKLGIPEDEVRRFAEADPAVRNGLLKVTIRPWMIGMGG
jgi:uncharacterized protein YciI